MKTIGKSSAVRALLSVAVVSLASILSISPGLASPDFGVRGGAYSDSEEPFVGAEALFDVGNGRRCPDSASFLTSSVPTIVRVGFRLAIVRFSRTFALLHQRPIE